MSQEQLNENIECDCRGHCDRESGVYKCSIGMYGQACELTTQITFNSNLIIIITPLQMTQNKSRLLLTTVQE